MCSVAMDEDAEARMTEAIVKERILRSGEGIAGERCLSFDVKGAVKVAQPEDRETGRKDCTEKLSKLSRK